MNTHWNAVWSNRHQRALSLFLSTAFCGNSTFPGLGFESQSSQFFRFFPSLNFLQRSINGEYFLNNFINWLIDWLISMSCHWSHITKNGLDRDSNPRPGNVEFEVKVELSQHAVEENRESALWVPIASQSVLMDVHWAVCSFRVNRILSKGVTTSLGAQNFYSVV